MDVGCVPEVTGTGLRLFSGILSVVDLSGNNLLTASSSGVLLGNTTDLPPVIIFSPLTTFFDNSGPTVALQLATAPLNQKITTIRLGGSGTGSFAISSTNDVTPTIAQENLLSANRTGSTFSSLQIGQGGSTFPTTFSSTGPVNFTGPINPNGLISGSSFVAAWPSGVQGGIFTAPNTPAGFSLYLVTVTIAAVNDPGNYNTVGLLSVNGNAARLTILQQGALMTMSLSGLTVLFTQINGATANVNSWWAKLI